MLVAVLSGRVGEAPAEAQSGARVITYSFERRGATSADLFEFVATVVRTLDDPRGWSLGGSVRFVPVAAGGQFRVVLASPSAVDAAGGVCDATYSCRVGNGVYINDLRWRVGAPAYTGSLADYRAYVINHEVGHWLGFGHSGCPTRGQPAPIMVQQSKSLGGCAPTAWPSGGERATLAARLGVRVGTPPFGSLDTVAMRGRHLDVAGWAIDPETAAPIQVHVYVDGRLAGGMAANGNRADVGAAFPAAGADHGFRLTFDVGGGVHDVCVYAIAADGELVATLGCRTLDHTRPFGAFDTVTPIAGGVRVSGWAIDPDATGPVPIHVHVDGVVHHGFTGPQHAARPDVAAVHPGYGTANGFVVDVPSISLDARLCAYALDDRGAPATLLGCK